MDEDIATAGFAEEDAIGAGIEKASVVPGRAACTRKEGTLGVVEAGNLL